jgi:hypothetical protein
MEGKNKLSMRDNEVEQKRVSKSKHMRWEEEAELDRLNGDKTGFYTSIFTFSERQSQRNTKACKEEIRSKCKQTGVEME